MRKENSCVHERERDANDSREKVVARKERNVLKVILVCEVKYSLKILLYV